MIVKYFSIWDKKAVTFGQMFPSHTLGTAERSFKDSMSNPDSPHSKYPDDFSLYLILEIDEDTGMVSQTYEPPQLVCHASDLTS